MMQKEIEVILARQLADYLTTPIFIVDPQGNLLFYNGPAEKVLGLRFEETHEMPVEVWSSVFKPTDESGNPLNAESLPLVIAHTQRRPAHRGLWIRGMDGVPRRLEVTAIPLIGQAGGYLGAMAIFWEVPG